MNLEIHFLTSQRQRFMSVDGRLQAALSSCPLGVHWFLELVPVFQVCKHVLIFLRLVPGQISIEILGNKLCHFAKNLKWQTSLTGNLF